MRVALSQINPTVGDLAGNTEIIKNQIMLALSHDCDVVLFPELATTGYPPRDYLYEPWIWDQHPIIAEEILAFIKQQNRQITAIYGGLHMRQRSHGVFDRFNAAYIVDPIGGIRITHKRLLPQYDVFDESRYFTSALNEPYRPLDIFIKRKKQFSVQCDILICEDIWNNRFTADGTLMPTAYDEDPIEKIINHSGPLFILNGSPFWQGKIFKTQALVKDICQRLKRPVCWVNQVGAHDDIVTGGYSMACIPGHPDDFSSESFRTGKMFADDLMIVRFGDESDYGDKHDDLWVGAPRPTESDLPVDIGDFDAYCDFMAIRLAIQDYCRRTGFKKIVFGSSGGIDSAVVGVLCGEAIGYENVTAISMPSKYSSEGSKDDAAQLAQNTGMNYLTLPIDGAYNEVKKSFLSAGKPHFSNSLTDENIQPRIRANFLMTYSNETDSLLVTTGNKSEITVGYCTLYGDTCGGLAVISDLWKTEVFRLAKFINKYRGTIIPESIITKPPSAELKPEQKDTDSLPPYDLLDPLLEMFVQDGLTPSDIYRSGKETNLSKQQIFDMYCKYRFSEYKRQQLAPGPKLKSRSFGSGRRMPIAAKPTIL